MTSVAARLVSNGGDVNAGLVLLKSPVVAGSVLATAVVRATLVPANLVRTFLANAKVNVATASFDSRAAVVRAICVRK